MVPESEFFGVSKESRNPVMRSLKQSETLSKPKLEVNQALLGRGKS